MKARILSLDCYDGAEMEVADTCFSLSLPSPHPIDSQPNNTYHLLGKAKDGVYVFVDIKLFEALANA